MPSQELGLVSDQPTTPQSIAEYVRDVVQGGGGATYIEMDDPCLLNMQDLKIIITAFRSFDIFE